MSGIVGSADVSESHSYVAVTQRAAGWCNAVEGCLKLAWERNSGNDGGIFQMLISHAGTLLRLTAVIGCM
ncbi:hypothetical protein [Paenibacillus sp. Soil522]|uniref:hypothetical protein n=1 Tax=Paenibacillus sp. Soil522 TaxID=1736388 RepID=UPI0006F9AE3E|nr:hypothetical protein [Paenibacillus sp. Soil522]KRE32598.1 hypothetical protein ASG81_24005 [Paenibacillus sp. Soil522]